VRLRGLETRDEKTELDVVRSAIEKGISRLEELRGKGCALQIGEMCACIARLLF